MVTIPALRDSCFFPIFSIALLPFPVSLIRIYNKLVGLTYEVLFLNLTPGIQILQEPHLPPINWSETEVVLPLYPSKATFRLLCPVMDFSVQKRQEISQKESRGDPQRS